MRYSSSSCGDKTTDNFGDEVVDMDPESLRLLLPLIQMNMSSPLLSSSNETIRLLEEFSSNVGSGANSSQQIIINPHRYKTELCRPFHETGRCRYANKCQFAHGEAELRTVPRHPKYKTEMCRTFHSSGICPYGPRCHFIHNEDEVRLSSISENRRSDLTRQAFQEMSQLEVKQHLIQGRVGMLISQLQQEVLQQQLITQVKQIQAAQRVVQQLAWGARQHRTSTGESAPMSPMSSPPPSAPTSPGAFYGFVEPPPGFQQGRNDNSSSEVGGSRLPVFTNLGSPK